mgnify:FL=1
MNKNAPEALKWIVDILRKNKIPFRISGGLAVRAYGSKRDLVDIDIEIRDKDFEKILPFIKKFKYVGPNKYRDDEWDTIGLAIDYKGQSVEFCGADSQKIFNKNTKIWERLESDLNDFENKIVFGIEVPIIPKKELIKYKSKIRIRVDLVDVEFLTRDP